MILVERDNATHGEELIRQADQAMYAEKLAKKRQRRPKAPKRTA